MKGKRYRLNIDRLEVCYTASREVIDGLEDTTFWDRGEYRLLEFSRDKIETILKIEVFTPSKEWVVFAWLRVGNKFEKEDDTSRYCWVSLENRALYSKGKEYGELPYLYYIAEDLGLKFNNISYLELAVDSNINWFRRVRAALRSEEFVPVVLGKAYPDKKTIIPRLLYIHTGDRERYKTNTLVLKSQNGEVALELYDKEAEIKASGKEYIRESFGISSGGLFRAEVKIRNRALSDFCTAYGMAQNDVYMRITDGSLLFDLFLFYSDRLLRFRERRSLVSVLQL